jgi:hypothetical protein
VCISASEACSPIQIRRVTGGDTPRRRAVSRTAPICCSSAIGCAYYSLSTTSKPTIQHPEWTGLRYDQTIELVKWLVDQEARPADRK